jgi:hypothetical protein
MEEYKNWELELNLDKTHYMCIGQQQSDLLLEGGELIKQCTEYKYLGMKINRQGKHDSKINETIKLGRHAISTLNSVLWDKNVIKIKKKCTYNTTVKVLPHMGVKFGKLKNKKYWLWK